MEQKELYTFEELCNDLEISMSAFSKRADVDEGTIARIRKGYPARNSTVNKLLRNFSEVYKIQLSRDNVLPWADEETEKTPVSSPVETTSPITANPQKRDYTREEVPADLPHGTAKLTDFTDTTGIPASTIGRWIREGKIEAITRDRASGVGEQKYLIPSEQEKARQLNQARTPRKTDAAPPDGFTYLSDFCTQHHVPYQAAADLFPRAIHGQPIKVGRRNYPVIGPRGRHDFYVQLHTSPDFVTCDDCPHEESV